MTTLITIGNSSSPTGRCDDRCHSAKNPECDCCCGGRYHGAKLDGTLDQKVAQFVDKMLKDNPDLVLKSHQFSLY